jgi:hypothetical protein
MFKDLVAVLGKNIETPEFKKVMAKYFPDFKKFNKDRNYRDKKSKVDLRIDSLNSYDDNWVPTNDLKEYEYFTAFFFGKDESEIPFGLSIKDDEATVIKKAGKPTHHNKNLEGGSFTHVNDLHYHIDNYKMVVAFDPATGKQWGINIQLRLKGMKF